MAYSFTTNGLDLQNQAQFRSSASLPIGGMALCSGSGSFAGKHMIVRCLGQIGGEPTHGYTYFSSTTVTFGNAIYADEAALLIRIA